MNGPSRTHNMFLTQIFQLWNWYIYCMYLFCNQNITVKNQMRMIGSKELKYQSWAQWLTNLRVDVEQIASQHNGNTLSASNHPNESVWSSNVTQRRFRLYDDENPSVVTATGKRALHQNVALYTAVYFSYWVRDIKDGRTRSRKWQIRHKGAAVLPRTENDPSPPSARAGFRWHPSFLLPPLQSFPLSCRDILRTPTFRNSERKK